MNLKKKLQKWLEIKEPIKPIEPTLNKELERQIQQLKKDLNYWHRIFRSFSVVPCAHCSKQLRIYPYGGAYYTVKDNQKVHAGCYDEFLASEKKGKE